MDGAGVALWRGHCLEMSVRLFTVMVERFELDTNRWPDTKEAEAFARMAFEIAATFHTVAGKYGHGPGQRIGAV